ncbi:ornithine cyclodeaminase family protein [Agrobacterium fabrum]|jgi:ornithine cyclodeaminase|uniref:ornithine cyclodeaminase family protein n=1 Tax=Agrobacterium fabrum TaxID=1176649 RepID=UPI00273D19C6|nr:ornithine cyclodeaminase family protein [Agrobacterium fabrum]WLP56264.1 ornithine cyclodeaminase family protein [Agrobacterium fabrum]
MLFISEEESATLVTHDLAFTAAWEALIAACDEATASFPVVLGHGSSIDNRFSVKAAATVELAGLKVGSYWPGNRDLGLSRHNSLILLFDQDTGRIGTAMEAGTVNAYRTAAADAVAADQLARRDAETLAIFGAGHQARYECMALARVRALRRVMIVARNGEQAEEMRSALRQYGLNAEVAAPQNACAEADIIVTATSSRAPLFEADWVRPGTHVASMGSDARGKQELPPALFARGDLFCDLPEQARSIGEFQHAAPDLEVTALGDVLAGRRPGRSSDSAITIFDSSGLSLQDLYIARHLLAKRGAHETPLSADN